MSMVDLRHCAAFDIASLGHLPGHDMVVGLHAETLTLVGSEEALA